MDSVVAVYHPFWHFRPELDHANIPVYLLGNRGAKDPKVVLRLIQLVRKHRFDLIHSLLRTPGLLARGVSILDSKIKVVISERNTSMDHSWFMLQLERLMAGIGDAMIANAEAIRSKVTDLIPRWQGRIHVVPNGIACSDVTEEIICQAEAFRSRYISDNGQKLIGIVASLDPQKDPNLLLDALEMLPDETLSRFRAVWVGGSIDHDLKAHVHRRLESGRLKDTFYFLPPTKQIRVVYHAIDALVLPSRWEGFPNVVLEALAEGKPVVGTDVGDVRKLIVYGKSGWIVPPEDAVKLSAAINEMVGKDKEQLVNMGKYGADYVRKFYSSERLVRETLDVYASVFGSTFL